MEGVLILAHGSRAKQTEETLNKVCEQVKEMLPNKLMQIAYMEFNDVNIATGLDALVAAGATQVNVIPYFLFDGIHIQEDIPNELEAYQKQHPDIKICMGKTLGADSRLAEILKDRIEECCH